MNQEERLEYLVDRFRRDSVRCRDLAVPADKAGRQRLLRSLMNIRMPEPMDRQVLFVQDEYLQERNREIGIVSADEICTAADQGSSVPHGDVLALWKGDITRIAADAIVNAANSQMLGCFIPMHSCIDNCIHTYAGIQLRAECSRKMDELRKKYGDDYEQPTAVPMLTEGYNLPAKKVVHIVGPIVEREVTPALEKDLADCYRNTLDLCAENGLKSAAFCSISTGVFRFPKELAAAIAVKTVSDWLDRHPGGMKKVIFNVFSEKDKCNYEKVLF